MTNIEKAKTMNYKSNKQTNNDILDQKINDDYNYINDKYNSKQSENIENSER